MPNPTYEQALDLLKDRGLSSNPGSRSSGQFTFGRQIFAFCPTHKDGEKSGRRSLSITPKFGLHCFAGCDRKDILEALGWASSSSSQDSQEGSLDRTNGHSTYPAPGKKKAPRSPKGDPDFEWKIRDENGAVVAVHGRWDLKHGSKTFAWRLPESRAWSGLGDEDLAERDLPPYGLEDLLNKDRRSESVWIVEGEKDRDACRDFGGILAISWAGGADQRFFPPEYLQHLDGRDLILWPDNDVPGWSFMNRFAIVTRAIARSSRILLVPGAKEKEGAYDWFVRRHGSVQELLQSLDGVITSPTVAFLSADTIQVTLPINEVGCSPVQLTFKNIQSAFGGRDGHTLASKMEVNLLGPAAEPYPYLQRINVLSHSSRESCGRELKSLWGQAYNWPKVLNIATVLVDRGLATRKRGIDTADIPSPGDSLYHIEGKYPLNEISLVFGDGQQMKSLQVQYEVWCAALGLDVAGKHATLPGPWVWVDYEQNQFKWRLRSERILAGLGYDEVPPMLVHYYPAEGLPIVELMPNLIQFCEEKGAVGCVVDSAMPMIGGDPNDNGLVSVSFNELNKLRMTTIIIAHMTKGGRENDKKPFGAGAWYFRPSYIWFVEKSGVVGHPDQLRCQWFARKHRDSKEPPSQSLLWTFDDPRGTIRIEPTNRQVSHHERTEIAIAQLLEQGTPMSVYELAETLEHSTRTIARTLRSFDKLFVKIESNGSRWTMRSLLPSLGLFPTDNNGAAEIPKEIADDPAMATILRFPSQELPVPVSSDDDLPFDPPSQDDPND